MVDFNTLEHSLIPEIESLQGTPKVDAREIAGAFSGTQKAIDLLNRLRPGFLNNVAYIYRDDDPSAYGVFNPQVDTTVKWLIVKEKLDKEGFKTTIDNDGKLYASSPNMTKEEIEQYMKKAFDKETSKGGITLGINIDQIVQKTQQMLSSPEFKQLTPEQQDDLKTANLTSVIAHEAVHTHGEKGESLPYQVQEQVLQEALKALNVPVQPSDGMMAAGKSYGWYKKAQLGTAFAPFGRNVGIELVLRTNQERSSLIFPVDRKINDSLETSLVKNTHSAEKEDESKSEEEILEKERIPVDSKTLESILNEKRAHPIILLIPKKASSNGLIKLAGWGSNIGGYHIGGVFGYMNGVQESWTQPFEASEIKDKVYTDENGGYSYWLRRYDQKYSRGTFGTDRMGHAEFKQDVQVNLADMDADRNTPKLWKDRDPYWSNRPDIAVSGSSNDSAYNTTGDREKNFIIQILRTVGYYKGLVKSGKRKAVRLVVDNEVLSQVAEAASDVNVLVFRDELKNKYVVWLFTNSPEERIKDIENLIQTGQDKQKVNDFVGLGDTIKTNINKILSKCKIICKEHGISDTYLVGGFVRTIASTKDFTQINDLDFSSTRPDDCLKLGGLLAADLGVQKTGYHHRSKTLTFEYDGIKMDFRGNYVPFDIRPLLREHGIETTPLNFDIYARDFTVNGLIYSFMDNKIYDITGRGINDLDAKILQTYFDSNIIIPLNPLIVTRALILVLRGFSLSSDLEKSIRQHSKEIFNGKESNERLAYEYEKISGYDQDGIDILKEYDIEDLKNIRDRVAQENPEFFSKE